MDIPVNPSTNFLLAIGGYLLVAFLSIIVFFIKRRNEEIDRQLERLGTREENRWAIYLDKHALLAGKVDILQDNYKSTMENIREDIREIKAQAGFIPVLKNELENMKQLLVDGFGIKTRKD